MKRYRFRLEQVLNVRRMQEDQAKAELLRANAEVDVTDRALEGRMDHYARIEPSHGVQPATLFLGHRFRQESAAAAVTAARAARAAAVAQAGVRRDAWSLAAKEVSVLERLDDRRREEHRLEGDRQEALEVDDLVVSRHGRQR